jgi:hypothetical protein
MMYISSRFDTSLSGVSTDAANFCFIVAFQRSEDETEIRNREQMIKDIRRATRKQYSAEKRIRIALKVLRGEESIAELCRREGSAESLYYN